MVSECSCVCSSPLTFYKLGQKKAKVKTPSFNADTPPRGHRVAFQLKKTKQKNPPKGVSSSTLRCVLPVPEAAGSQVRKLTVFESTFDQLIQRVMEKRLMLSVDVLNPLKTHNTDQITPPLKPFYNKAGYQSLIKGQNSVDVLFRKRNFLFSI